MALEARHQATRQGTAKPPGIPSAGRSKVVGECGVEGVVERWCVEPVGVELTRWS